MDQKGIRNYVGTLLKGADPSKLSQVEERFMLAWYAKAIDRPHFPGKRKRRS